MSSWVRLSYMPSFSILPRPSLGTEDKTHWMKEAARGMHSCGERRGSVQSSWAGLTQVPEHFLEKTAEEVGSSLLARHFRSLTTGS